MGYRELLEIYRQESVEYERQLSEPPVACSNDGEPLEDTDRGLHCRFCGRIFDDGGS